MPNHKRVPEYRGDCPLCGDPIIGQYPSQDRFVCIEGRDVRVHAIRCNPEFDDLPRFLPKQQAA